MVSGNRRPDEVPGTGHEWDGITELDTPLPRWWLWTFYATILWSIAYCVAMPAWPLLNDYTRGLLGYSQRAVVAGHLDQARQAQRPFLDRIAAASLEDIRSDPELLSFALAGGRSAFAVNCSQCHGSGGQGSPGFPNLNDDAWLWGGTLEEIAYTIRHGIRTGGEEARDGLMPAFGRDELLEPDQLRDVVQHVLALATGAAVDGPGAAVFAEQCASCHGEKGRGNAEFGAPDLTDSIWLHGGSAAAIREQVWMGGGGVMPAWKDRLSPETIKQLTVYVHALGGGR